MVVGGSLRVSMNDLVGMSKAAELVVDDAVREVAVELLRRSQVYLLKYVYTRPNQVVEVDDGSVPEPTGALGNSGYFRTAHEDGESEALASAEKSRPGVRFGDAPTGALQKGQAQVIYAVEYAIYIEAGTKFMAARPFLSPAASECMEFFEAFIRSRLNEVFG